jgi:hypothetical protein
MLRLLPGPQALYALCAAGGLWFAAASAVAQPSGSLRAEDTRIQTRRPGDLAPVLAEDLDRLQQRVAPCVHRVRATTDLGPGYHPRRLEGDGVATWIALPDGPALVTAFTWLATAETVEVETRDGTWHPAVVLYGTPLYDLAALRVDAPPACDPLPIPEELPLDASVFSCADAICSAFLINAIGAPVPEDWSYYIRTSLPQRNGPIVVDRVGNVIAIASVFAPQGAGTFAIPMRWLTAWQQEWPQLVPSVNGGWSPRVRVESFDLTTGGGAR